MNNLNRIGLDQAKAKNIAEKLNDLLANYSVFYQNLRGFHWNVQGDKFFKLHDKFEELYTDLIDKIDEVAERILTLEHTPEHNYSVYLKISEVEESADITDGFQMAQKVVDSFKTIIIKQREILSLAGDANDEGTVALMSDYITSQEKTVWMYSAFLAK